MTTALELRLLRVVRTLRKRKPIGAHRTHKASSAESILRHCLRQRGWTADYRRGELTQHRHMELLHDVRQYGRAWLRHEAEQFARLYLGGDVLPRSIELGIAKDVASHFGRFFGRTKQFVRELIVAGMAALSGPAPLTGEELETADREATRQGQFFDQFYDEIKFWGKPSPKEIPAPRLPIGLPIPTKPPMTPGQFVARVESYADSTHGAAQKANRLAAIRNPAFKVERLILGAADHCSECPADAAKGWVPIGTSKPIGSRECKHFCMCHFIYAASPTGQAFVQGKAVLPAPRVTGVQAEPEDGRKHPVAYPPDVRVEPDDGGKYPVAGPPR